MLHSWRKSERHWIGVLLVMGLAPQGFGQGFSDRILVVNPGRKRARG